MRPTLGPGSLTFPNEASLREKSRPACAQGYGGRNVCTWPAVALAKGAGMTMIFWQRTMKRCVHAVAACGGKWLRAVRRCRRWGRSPPKRNPATPYLWDNNKAPAPVINITAKPQIMANGNLATCDSHRCGPADALAGSGHPKPLRDQYCRVRRCNFLDSPDAVHRTRILKSSCTLHPRARRHRRRNREP